MIEQTANMGDLKNTNGKLLVAYGISINIDDNTFTLSEFLERLGFEIIPCTHWLNRKTCEICNPEIWRNK